MKKENYFEIATFLTNKWGSRRSGNLKSGKKHIVGKFNIFVSALEVPHSKIKLIFPLPYPIIYKHNPEISNNFLKGIFHCKNSSFDKQCI